MKKHLLIFALLSLILGCMASGLGLYIFFAKQFIFALLPCVVIAAVGIFVGLRLFFDLFFMADLTLKQLEEEKRILKDSGEHVIPKQKLTISQKNLINLYLEFGEWDVIKFEEMAKRKGFRNEDFESFILAMNRVRNAMVLRNPSIHYDFSKESKAFKREAILENGYTKEY